MDLTPIFIIGILTLGTYRLFELYARRKERMAIIEKMEHLKGDQELPLYNNSKFGSLKLALLLIGVGLGCLLGFILESYFSHLDYYAKGILYFSVIATFGGLGLLISYLIESKQTKSKGK